MIIAISLALCLIVLGIAVYSTFRKMTQAQTKSLEQCFDVVCRNGLYSRDEFATLEKEDVEISSFDGLKMRGYFIEPYKEEKKVMVLVHGYTDAHPWSLQFARMFISMGFNVLAYDLRRHGESEGKYTTLGYKEKQDLAAWVKWVLQRKGEDCLIGLHGQSMGAATVLEYGADSGNQVHPAFIISDCAYSDLYKLIRYMAEKRNVPFLPAARLLDTLLYYKAGFRLKNVSPLRAVRKSSVPTMFIHGTSDTFVPYQMSEELYKEKNGPKKLLLVDGAKHCRSYQADREVYEQEVKNFVADVLKSYVPVTSFDWKISDSAK